MARVPVSGANVENPTHPVMLSDGSTKLGLRLCDPRGKDDFYAIRRAPYPRTGLKISQQETKYSDAELPYVSIQQDNWSSGRGADIFEDDKSRYADNRASHGDLSGIFMPGAMEQYMDGLCPINSVRTNTFRLNVGVRTYTTFGPSLEAIATKITKGTVAVFDEIIFYVKYQAANIGTGNLYVELWSDLAGTPNAKLSDVGSIVEGTLPDAGDVDTDTCFVMKSTVSLGAPADYWVVFLSSNPRWGLMCNNVTPTTNTKAYNGVAWNNSVWGDLYFGCKDIDNYIDDERSHLILYKDSMYAMVNGFLYLNGDLGAADVGAFGQLADATKTWTVNEWAGCTVILRRPGSTAAYSAITSNTANTLTLADTNVSPELGDEYAILGSNKWTFFPFSGLSGSFATDIAVAGDSIYVAYGNSAYITRCEWHVNSAGTLVATTTGEYLKAHRLCGIFNPGDSNHYLFGTLWTDQLNGRSVWKMRVPPIPPPTGGSPAPYPGYLYRNIGTLCELDQPWDDLTLANVTTTIEDLNGAAASQKNTLKIDIAAGHTTGLLALKYLDVPIDITEARHIALKLKSDVALNANDAQLTLYDDDITEVPNTRGRYRNPAVLKHYTGAYADMAAARDADVGTNYAITFNTAQYVYIGSSVPFGHISINFGTTKNGNVSALTVQYMSQRDGLWTTLTITDGTRDAGLTKTWNQDGVISFTMPEDWQTWTVDGGTYYFVRLSVSANLTPAIDLAEVRLWRGITAINLPAITAGEWMWITLDISPNQRPWPDDTIVKGIGLYQAVDKGANVIRLQGEIILTSYAPGYIQSPSPGRINKVVPYGEDNTRPWIITSDGVHEIQIDNNDVVISIPLYELKQLASPINGIAAVANDVYLYYSMGRRLERYHDRLLEDVGPDRDEGLPIERRGDIIGIASLPGAVCVAVQGNPYSSVLIRRGGGWHELYRSPMSYTGAGVISPQKIRAIAPQPIPGGAIRMFVLHGNYVLAFNIQMSKGENHGHYKDFSFVTPWITMGFHDVSKVWRTLKLYTNLESTNVINVYYQVESGSLESSGTWTNISFAGAPFSVSPFQSRAIDKKTDGSQGTVTGKRIRLRFDLTNLDVTKKSLLIAWILDALLRLEVKYAYTLTVRLADRDSGLAGDDDYELRMETLQSQLDTWAGSPPTILTMNCIYSPFDGKSVIIEPMPIRPYPVTIVESGKSVEAHVADITLLEV